MTSREWTRANYDRLSGWYDLFSASERRFTLAGVRLLALQPGESVLEIGFGTGHALIAMQRLVTRRGQVHGIDLSPGMLRRAREKLEQLGLGDAIQLQTGDALHLPYPTLSMDAIFMSFTLELFVDDEIPAVLAECRRVLKPSGRLGIVSLVKEDTRAVGIYEWFHRRLPRLVDCRPILPQALLERAGYHVTAAQRAAVWGLPVTLLTACPRAGA